ncbi:glycosyltransferase [Agromyces sp. NPDC057679]|uniref:glycosyltransferase n=1 Tax=Agromyces sp. NPDC057679 TaxID=3346207 RepID=UPI00366CDE6B
MTHVGTDDGLELEDREGLVVLASGNSWDDTWLSDKHLAVHLSTTMPVLFVDPAMSMLTPLRKPALRRGRAPRLRRIAPGLVRLTPVTVPGITRPVLREIGEWVTRRAIARAVRRLGGEPRALIVGSLDDVFDACPSAVKILYGTDDWSAGADILGLSAASLRRREARQLGKADLAVAVSDVIADRWAAPGRAIEIIPNGCDTERFAAVDTAIPAADVTLPPPIAGFVGHLSERIDLTMLEAVADTGASLLLVGPRQLTFDLDRVGALLERPNVQWVGAQPFESLPSYLRLISVGLTPYTDSEFNRASHPLKTLEYLAAGRPAVVSDLPSTRKIPPGLVDIASSPAQFAELTLRALRAAPDPAAAARRAAYAQRQSWASRAADFAALIEGRSGGSAR